MNTFTLEPCSCHLFLFSRDMSSAPTTPPSVDKVDGFSRKSVRKARQKRSQSSSQFRSQGKPIELTPLPLLKGKPREQVAPPSFPIDQCLHSISYLLTSRVVAWRVERFQTQKFPVCDQVYLFSFLKGSSKETYHPIGEFLQLISWKTKWQKCLFLFLSLNICVCV